MVQALRAAACLLVVIYHAAGGEHGPWPNGAAGVDLFFVISGYVMIVSSRGLMAGPRPARIFLVRRARRIVPLYWLVTAAKGAIVALSPALTPATRPTVWNIAASLLFIPARDSAGFVRPLLGVGWTLNFEVFFYALFAAALALRLHPLWITPILLALTFAGFCRDATWPAPLSLANGMVLEFAAGLLLGTAHITAKPRMALAMLVVGTTSLLAFPSCGPWRCLAWGLPATAILAGAVALEAHFGRFLPSWLLAIGDASYAIYLVHPFVVPVFAGHGAAACICSVPASLAAGWLVHRHVDSWLQRQFRSASSYQVRAEKEGVLF